MPTSPVMTFRRLPRLNPDRLRQDHAGFTLVELCVVVLIVGSICAIALPQFLPLLVFSELEAEARRLAHYGSGAIAEASLFGSDITVYIDLDAQEYYASRLVYPDEAEEGVNQMELFSSFRRSGNYSAGDISEMLSGTSQGGQRSSSTLPDDFDTAEADAQMQDQFTTRHRQMIYARAQNVIQDSGILSDIGPLFEREFSLSWSEPVEEELDDPILRRYKMPQGVRIVNVRIENSAISSGVAEIKALPMGLEYYVTIHVQNDDNEYFTVGWNPLTGRGVFREGRQDY